MNVDSHSRAVIPVPRKPRVLPVGLNMIKGEEKLLNYIKVLADESKYKIILHLMNGEECVCMIAQKLSMEQSLVSHHLKTLRETGFIKDRKVGTWVHCSLNKKAFEDLEGLYQRVFSPKNISDKPCAAHEICKKIVQENL